MSFYRYNRPGSRPEPKVTIDSAITDICRTSHFFLEAERKDLIWKLVRQNINKDEQQKCPGWLGFNSYTTVTKWPITTVRYLPFIEAPPTDMTTIYNMLLKLVRLAEQLKQPHILVTADMAIYSKAQEILWTRPPDLDGKVTMRIGGMHMTMSFLGSIGHLYRDGGLLTLLTESELYAAATAQQILQGHQYSRGLRAILLVHEALFRIFMTAMESWLNMKGNSLGAHTFNIKLQKLSEAFDAKDQAAAMDLVEDLEKEDFSTFQNAIEHFKEAGCKQSETFALWSHFLDAGGILMRLLRAEREGNFHLHLSAMCETIPWLWAAGRNTYAKYIPTYVSDMKALQKEHPETYEHMCNGGFVARRSLNKNFNCVATDQALEQTVNRDGKSKGGVIGLTLRKGALIRWLKTRHVTSEYVQLFRSMCITHHGCDKHEELGKARMEKDENAVCQIINTVCQYQNPFDVNTIPSELINITTGQIASPEVRKSMVSFLDSGTKKHEEFLARKLVQNTKDRSFWHRESRVNIKTFAHMLKSLKINKSDKMLMDSEVLFRRLLFVSKQREVNLQLVLEHELTAVPPSLFHDDGSMRKNTKADLAKKLEATCQEVYSLTQDIRTLCIIDCMALLQGLREAYFSTFDELARHVMHHIITLLNNRNGVEVIVMVFDRYDNGQSIKQIERRRRGDKNKASYIINGNNTVPNYRKFMANSGNKASLASFISEYFVKWCPNMLQSNQSILLSGGFSEGHLVKQITQNNVAALPELFSTQEEADTRMVLHAVHLSSTFPRIIVQSDDTDVLILLVYYVSKGMLDSLVYMQAGHSTQVTNRRRYIPINTIVEKVGHDVCQNLPAAHALTGCDTTSSLFGVGKRVAYTKLVEHVKQIPSAFKTFGLSDSVDDDFCAAQAYVLKFYSIKLKGAKCTSLNKLRHIYASSTDRSAAQFPPTEDAFKQHVMRARYQASIWCQSHICNPVLDDPLYNGWKLTQESMLEPVMFTKEVAPVQVRDLTHLYCTDRDCSIGKKCQCVLSGLQCTDYCACHSNCCNKSITIDSDNDDNDA